MGKRKRVLKQSERPVDYILLIRRWDWSYSFGLNSVKWDQDPYMEFRHLTILGEFVAPRALNGHEAEFTVIPDERLNEAVRIKNRTEPLAVGSLARIRGGGGYRGFLSLPKDALGQWLSMLVAERFQFIVGHGTGFGRNGTRLRSYRLTSTVTDDDW